MEVQITTTNIMVPKEYAALLAGAGAICLLYMLTMYMYTMSARINTYRRGFMRQFDQIH